MAKIKVTAIKKSVIEMIMAAAKDNHPNEFACMLRGIEGIVTEVILVPGTITGNTSALLRLHMLPIDFTIVGSAHSHPSPSFRPSRQDIGFFANFGPVHIIAAYPYTLDSWAVYDRNGNPIELKVI